MSKFQNPATKGTIKKRKYVTANEISGTLEYLRGHSEVEPKGRIESVVFHEQMDKNRE